MQLTRAKESVRLTGDMRKSLSSSATLGPVSCAPIESYDPTAEAVYELVRGATLLKAVRNVGAWCAGAAQCVQMSVSALSAEQQGDPFFVFFFCLDTREDPIFASSACQRVSGARLFDRERVCFPHAPRLTLVSAARSCWRLGEGGEGK